jgi:hypothetical protein
MEQQQTPRIVKEVLTRYYVQLGDWIQAGPFDTREEAKIVLKQIRSKELADYTNPLPK